MRINAFRIMFVVALGIGLAAEGVFGRTLPFHREVTLLIVPARPRIIQLAFDMVQLRSIALVAYHGEAKTAQPVLHIWSGSDWQYISLANFTDKQFIITGVKKAIVIGDHQTVPTVLLRSMPWCSDIELLPTLNVANLINSLDLSFQFRKREWKWLSGRYGLTLIDLNAARRANNPYDTPRSKRPLEKHEFKQEEGDLAPAQLIEKKPAGAPASAAKSETKPVEKPPK